MNIDEYLVTRIREELYMGYILEAEYIASEIQDSDLQKEMIELIKNHGTGV